MKDKLGGDIMAELAAKVYSHTKDDDAKKQRV